MVVDWHISFVSMRVKTPSKTVGERLGGGDLGLTAGFENAAAFHRNKIDIAQPDETMARYRLG